MAVTVAAFRERFPAPLFSAESEDSIAMAISDAQMLHTASELGTLLCAAHLLAVQSEDASAPDGGSGVVQKEKIGPRDITYLSDAGTDERRAFYATTSFGRRLMAIEARTPRMALGATIA